MRRCHPLPARVAHCLWVLGWLLSLAAAPAASRPNILLLIADDYGADASSLYNSTNTGARLPQTPNIASLVTNGVVFRNAYANPLCSPTRACLLTGRHGFRTGMGDVVLGPMGAQGPLAASEFTLPRALAQGGLGYQAAQFGKWHLANGTNAPLAVGGWTHYAGNLIGQVTNYFLWAKTSNSVQRASTNYVTTDLVNDAIAWIQARGTNAWLVWAAFNAPHSPYHLPPTNLCPRLASLPGTPADISANPLNYYHAMVEALDTEIGRLLAALPDRANTHVIFLGDNGSTSSLVQPPYASGRAKGTLYEGGVRVPLIISGPAVARPNRTNDTLVHATDLFPTLLELAGGNPAAVVPTNVILDGRSLLGALQTTNVLARRAYAELFGSTLSTNVGGQALREDRYKLIRFTSGQQRFHDLQADPAEQVNLLAGVLTAAQQAAYHRLAFALYGYTTNQGPAIAGSAWSNGMFSLRVGPAAAYTLWRSAEPSAGDWAPVTNAMALTNGGVVMVTDPAPPAGRALYKVVR